VTAQTTDLVFTRQEAMVAMNGARFGCRYGWA
jgi:hypothetical protein